MTYRAQQAAELAEQWDLSAAAELLTESLSEDECLLLGCIFYHDGRHADLQGLADAFPEELDLQRLALCDAARQGRPVGPPEETDLAGFSDWLLSATAMESIHVTTPNLDLQVALAEERLRRARLDPEGNFEPEQAERDLLSTLRFARRNEQLVSLVEGIFARGASAEHLINAAGTLMDSAPVRIVDLLNPLFGDVVTDPLDLIITSAEALLHSGQGAAAMDLLVRAEVLTEESCWTQLEAWIQAREAYDGLNSSAASYRIAALPLAAFLPAAALLGEAAVAYRQGDAPLGRTLGAQALRHPDLNRLPDEYPPEHQVAVQFMRDPDGQGDASRKGILRLTAPGWDEALAALWSDGELAPDLRAQALLLSVRVHEVQNGNGPVVREAARKVEALAGVSLYSAHLLDIDFTPTEVMTRRLSALAASGRRDATYFYYVIENYGRRRPESIVEHLELHALAMAEPPELAPRIQPAARDFFRRLGWWPQPILELGLEAEAREVARLLLVDGVTDSTVLFDCAYLLDGQPGADNLTEALYRQLIEHHPEHAAGQYNLALRLEAAGDTEAALRHYQAAAEADPDDAEAFGAVARLMAPSGALRFTADPAAPPALQRYGQMYWERNESGWTYNLKEITAITGVKQANNRADRGGQATDPGSPCRRCGKVARPYASRTDYDAHLGQPRPLSYACPDCAAIQVATEADLRRVLEARRRQALYARFPLGDTVNLLDLSLRDTVTLTSLIRTCASEDFTYLHPIVDSSHGPLRKDAPLCASAASATSLIRDLCDRGLIVPHPGSPLVAFGFEDDRAVSLDIDRVIWRIDQGEKNGFGETYSRLQADLRRPYPAWPEAWQRELPYLARDLLRDEALAHLQHKLSEHRLTLRPGEKTIAVLDTLLEHFTLAMVWNLNWQAATSASSFKVTKGVGSAHAANTAITVLERRGETLLAEGRRPNPARRDWATPVPALSQVLFVTALGLSDPPYHDRLFSELPADLLGRQADEGETGN